MRNADRTDRIDRTDLDDRIAAVATDPDAAIAAIAALPASPATLTPRRPLPMDDTSVRTFGSLHELFRRLAHTTAYIIGTPVAFMIAMVTIIAWALSGPVFHYSDTWQLVINTGTTIVTFLVVFMIQNTQNRDSQAIHLKLDELIRSVATARNALVDVEDRPDAELARLQREMREACDEPDAPT
jgi:low affinity Fe/Cu permease